MLFQLLLDVGEEGRRCWGVCGGEHKVLNYEDAQGTGLLVERLGEVATVAQDAQSVQVAGAGVFEQGCVVVGGRQVGGV